MKRIFNLFAFAAIAALTLAGCSKNDQNAPEKEAEQMHITVKANVQDLKGEPGTKTYIDGNTILWGTGEYMKIAVQGTSETVFGNSSDATADLWDGDSEAMFEFSITPPEGTEYKYMGLYPASSVVTTANNTHPESYNVILPDIQNATASSYDPAAYIMIAKPEVKSSALTEWEASYRRATALNKITLTNINDDIVSVEITAADNIYLAGRRHINLTTGENGELYDDPLYKTETITVKYATALPSANNKVIWFTSWGAEIPEGSTLKIVAKSATKSYTRILTARSSGISFKEGYLNTLNVNMSSADVDNISGLAEGNYVILAKNGDSYYALKAEVSGTTTLRIASVDYTGSTTSYEGTETNLVWAVAKSGSSYTISNSDKYVGWTPASGSAANNADLTTLDSYEGKYLLSIDENGDGTYKVYLTEETSRIFARNNSSAYFAFYGNTQYKNIVFVPATIDTRTSVTLSFSTATVEKNTDNYSEFTGQTATSDPNVTAVTSNISYALSGAAIGTVDSSTGEVTLNGTTGTATITASFAGDDNYTPASASYAITVSQAPSGDPASYGDVIWEEYFNGCADASQPASGTVALFGGGHAGYSYDGSYTKIYASSGSLGHLPELLIAKSSRSETWTVSGIPTAGWSAFTLEYLSNQNLTISGSGVSVTDVSHDGNNYVKIIEVSGSPSSFSLVFSMSSDNNARIDNIVLSAGAPIAGITVATNAATNTASSAGTTATLNGAISLVNGAVIGNLTEAGFYYKKTSDASYTKVTCASVPSITNFSYDVTGLTKDAEYTYYAYAIYDSGSEVDGETVTFTPTISISSKTYTLTISANDFNTTSYAANNNEKTSTAKASDNSEITVAWTSNQVMKSGNNMQWQKSKGYIYNSTDLGTIKSVTINSSAGEFTTYYGTSEQPSSSTTIGDGFFQIKVGGATGTTSDVVIVFEK